MIERLIEWSIRHRAATIVAACVLAVCGVIAVGRTPMDAIPDLSENQVLVFADWPGHNPRELDEQVTATLSRHLQGIDGVRVVRGASEAGYSLLHLIFEESIRFETARSRVQERLTLLGDALPQGVTPRLSPDAVPTGQIFWYTLEGADLDLGRLRDLQDWYLQPQLSSVPGVAEVASVGGFVREFVVEADLAKLQDIGLTPRDLCEVIEHSQAILGGNVLHKGSSEFLVSVPAGFGASTSSDHESQVLRDLEAVLVPLPKGEGAERARRLGEIARVTIAPRPRRGVFEKDGNEVVGGVVTMRYGHNPLEVTRAIRRKLTELRAGLPHGVRVIPCYDRTPLIEGAVATVTNTVLEAMFGATLCVLLVMRHLRSSFVIAVTLPLAALTSFVLMALLRSLGVADIQTNIMSLSGIAISIGVLVDSSIVMTENAMTHLHRQFGERPVTGDVRATVAAACRMVGRPIVCSVLIMLVSFLPVFALEGIDGKLFRPLAFTKTFALMAVAVLSVTLVPALCTLFLRGRMRAESESWLVRGVMEVYRPVLNFLLDHPAVMAWIISVTFIVGVTPIGHDSLSRAVLFGSLVVSGFLTPPGLPRWLVGFCTTLFATKLESRSCSAKTREPPPRGGWGLVTWASLIAVALIAQQTMQPLGTDLRVPLDEGMVMDMPITVPRISVTQSGDDLKARDMLLCRFPEVDMVVGKAGRAESPFDPAPLDMIETMVNFRPAEFWPKRKLHRADAERQGQAVLDSLLQAKLIGTHQAPPRGVSVTEQVESVAAALARCELGLREVAYLRNQEFQRRLGERLIWEALARLTTRWLQEGRLTRELQAGDLAWLQGELSSHLGHHLAMSLEEDDLRTIAEQTLAKLSDEKLLQTDVVPQPADWPTRLWRTGNEWIGRETPTEFATLRSELLRVHRSAWSEHADSVNRSLFDRGLRSFTQLVAEELLTRAEEVDPRVETWLDQLAAARKPQSAPIAAPQESAASEHHHTSRNLPPLPIIDPLPELDAVIAEQTNRFARWAFLWSCERDELAGFGGELDRALQMPGWTNVWTRPIQNRVDMLATGVNTEIGVRVLGRNLDEVVAASEEIAAVLRGVPGAADVIADPVRGKGYLEIVPNRERLAEHGVDPRDVWHVIETALGGKSLATVLNGRERHGVRLRATRDEVRDELAVRQLPVRCRWGDPTQSFVTLGDVADVRLAEGPASIKSENGWLRNYVRLNVRGRGTLEFLTDAKRAVAEEIELPVGTSLEWTGQFEHAEQTARTLLFVTPTVIGLILLILWLTYRDLADTCLMMLAVPGAIAGGVLFQWLFGFRWSMPVVIGYLACFGMATSTGIIMLVYLREALEKRGPLASLTETELRTAVLEGAVHRLRPKLLTEGTTILGLVPMLWATGVGADVIRPMAAPVLGGILIADEVIDLLLPVLFYQVRRRRWQAAQQSPSTMADDSTKLSGPVAGPVL